MSAANWINVSRFGSAFEEEVDINATPMRYRHRAANLGDGRLEQHGRINAVRDWTDGPAPDHRKAKA